MYGNRPSRLEMKNALVGDVITIYSHDKGAGVDLTVGGLVTNIKRSQVSPDHLVVTLGRGYIHSLPRTEQVKLHSSVLRDEGIAMVTGGSPTLNVTYVRVGGCLYRITYDWMTDKAVRTSVTTIPEEEQMLESVGKNQSNRESKIQISMNVPLTTEDAAAILFPTVNKRRKDPRP